MWCHVISVPQERDLEVELGDDYYLDLNSTYSCCVYVLYIYQYRCKHESLSQERSLFAVVSFTLCLRVVVLVSTVGEYMQTSYIRYTVCGISDELLFGYVLVAVNCRLTDVRNVRQGGVHKCLM